MLILDENFLVLTIHIATNVIKYFQNIFLLENIYRINQTQLIDKIFCLTAKNVFARIEKMRSGQAQKLRFDHGGIT